MIKTKKMLPLQCDVGRMILICSGLIIFSSSYAEEFDLGATKGFSPLQSVTGTAVQQVCQGLPSQGDTLQQDLSVQCTAMVLTGLEIQKGQPVQGSLGLDSAGLGGALQNVATEELGTTSRVATSTLSGQIATLGAHLLTLHNLGLGGGASADEQYGLLTNRLSVFANAIGGFGDLNASASENAADFSTGGVVIGMDYHFTDHFVAGIAAGYSHLDSGYKTNINVSGGDIISDFGNLSIYSGYEINDFYFDGIFAYGWSAYDINRSIFIQNNTGVAGGARRNASASADGRQISVAFNSGYNFHHGAVNIRPYVGVNYFDGQIDAYHEQGALGLNLNVDEQNFDSLQTVLGTQISYAFSQSFGVIIPQADFSWHHEYENNQRAIIARYAADPNGFILRAVTDTPDRDFFLLGAGVSSVLQGGAQLFFNYHTVLGYRRVTSHGFTAGVRMEF